MESWETKLTECMEVKKVFEGLVEAEAPKGVLESLEQLEALV